MRVERYLDARPAGHALALACRMGIPRELAGHYAAREFNRVPKTRASREEVALVLQANNERLGNLEASQLCSALKGDQATVVITGQQPGLFGGPLFTLEKLAGTIALARRITSETGRPCVPIFWNQSEDHDLVEVNRMETPRLDGVHREVAPIQDSGRCLDRIIISSEVRAFAAEALHRSFGEIAWPPWVMPAVGERFPDWTSRVLVNVFRDTPFLLAEPHWFRQLAAPLYRRAVVEVGAWHQALVADTQHIASLGYHPQIETEEPSGLFVVSADGTRLRLSQGTPWRDASGHEYSESDLLDIIQDDPSRISTSVQVRPLVQQWLFPVVAQVGGPAEVAYFAQFPSLFKAAGLELPSIIQRPASILIGHKEAKWVEGLGLKTSQLLDDPASWNSIQAADPIPAKVRQDLNAAVSGLRSVATSDPMARAVDGFAKQIDHAYEKISATMIRDRERAEGVQGDRRQRLANWVRPKGRPQDRMLTLPELLARMSLDEVRAWLSKLDPMDPTTVIAMSESV